jgi:hypothetical protein
MGQENKMENVDCNTCGISFSFSEKVAEMWKRSHKTFYCPNGHSLHWPGETPEQKELKSLKEEVASLSEKLMNALNDADEKAKKIEELTSELEIWKPASSKEVA